MVLIPIRAPLLSLCITIISVICELAFLTAALTFLRYLACRRLKSKKKVPIRSQHRKVLAVTLFAMLAFVTLETVTSVFSDPQTRIAFDIQPCLRNVLGSDVDEGPAQSEAIHFVCTKINDTTVSHAEGNFSTVTRKITCSEQPIYSYVIGEQLNRSAEGAVSSCLFNLCAFARIDNDTLFFSGPQAKGDEIITYIPTALAPGEGKRVNLTTISAKLAQIYEDSIMEEGEVRRRALLGSVEDECPFPRDNGPATTIPLGVLIGAGVVWALSLSFFLISLVIRRKIFFDITHPMHWARRAQHDQVRALGDNPELEMIDVDGEYTIAVTNYLRRDPERRKRYVDSRDGKVPFKKRHLWFR